MLTKVLLILLLLVSMAYADDDVVVISTATTVVQTLTIQPSTIDSYLDRGSVNANYGNATALEITRLSTSWRKRGIFEFDFTALPGGATITVATLYLYYYDWDYNDPVGSQIDIVRVTQTGWTEGGVTWNCARDDNLDGTCDVDWVLDGGDYTTEDLASTTIPAGSGWITWDVTEQVKDAQSGAGEIYHSIFKFNNEVGTESTIYIYSSEFGTTTLRPKLIIQYVE